MKEKVTIEGREETLNPDTMIKIGANYYYRDSKEIVLVNTSKGNRYRRAKSPLIRRLGYNGSYCDIVDIVISKSGVEFNKNDSSVIIVDGDYTLKKLCHKMPDGSYAIISKTDILGYDGCLIKSGNEVALSSKFYKESSGYSRNTDGIFYYKKDRCVITDNGDWIVEGDSAELMNDTGKLGVFHRSETSGATAFLKFREYRSGNQGRIRSVPLARKYAREKYIECERTGLLVHETMYEEYEALVNAFRARGVRDSTANVKKRMNDFYSDAGKDENNATKISMDYDTRGGGQIFYKAPTEKNYSRTTRKTGGIKYTFGVEFETSAGQMGDATCKKVDIDKVGDRSIGAYEYVTGVLHGDNGMKTIEAQSASLGRTTLVDDRCSIHVHVGGDTGSSLVETPKFGRSLSVALVSLGAQLEDELYAMSPPSRNKDLKHCAPIARWKGIKRDDHDILLGSFLFGGNHDGSISDEEVVSGRYKFSELSKNYSRQSSKWIGARYKWLNLLNIHTARGFKTVEIRMWAGSTSYDKIKNYVLLSLAFVKFAENNQRAIFDKEQVKLSDVISLAFSSDTSIRDELLAFVKERTKKFKTKRLQLN